MSSTLDRLVMMANQIGKFFEPQREGDPVAGIADHLEKFWDPRMKASIVAHLAGRRGGAGRPCSRGRREAKGGETRGAS